MFISPVSSLNCKKPCKTSFCLNPESAEKAAKKIAENVPVKNDKTLFGKWLDDFFKEVAKSQEESSVDSPFVTFAGFNPDMINYL